MDWVLVPPGTAAGGTPAPGMPPPQQPATPQPAQSALGAPQDYRGPFVGVRPGQTGEAYITLNGADRYENWVYTVVELQQELARLGGYHRASLIRSQTPV